MFGQHAMQNKYSSQSGAMSTGIWEASEAAQGAAPANAEQETISAPGLALTYLFLYLVCFCLSSTSFPIHHVVTSFYSHQPLKLKGVSG